MAKDLRVVAVDADEDEGDLLIVEGEPRAGGGGWMWLARTGDLHPVEAYALATRDPYRWKLADPGTPVPAEARSAVEASS